MDKIDYGWNIDLVTVKMFIIYLFFFFVLNKKIHIVRRNVYVDINYMNEKKIEQKRKKNKNPCLSKRAKESESVQERRRRRIKTAALIDVDVTKINLFCFHFLFVVFFSSSSFFSKFYTVSTSMISYLQSVVLNLCVYTMPMRK